MSFEYSEEYAQRLDQQDSLAAYRDRFFFPKHNGREVVYFTGNSLGLQPKTAQAALQQELDDWAKWGVEGHFQAKHPWFAYHEMFAEPMMRLVGAAKKEEVVAMNGLTVNLHLLLASFYRPTPERYKIICEAKAFPSDQYALESQVRLYGLDPEDAIIEIGPREGEHLVNLEDVLSAIQEHKSELALVMIGGVNYYSGQVFDMKAIAEAGHQAGAMVGFDLAHAAGNIPLQLHDWNVDFAAWCSYKYLNSGPGSVSGVFVHEKHHSSDLPRMAGWWGHNKEERFLMEKGFKPIHSAEGWQLSNAPVFSMAVYKASLDIFDEVGMAALRKKSEQLTAYLEFVIRQVSEVTEGIDFEIITPKDPQQRGCQLSILAHGGGKKLFDKLTQEGVIADWREPNVIRIAPVPLYNSFMDAYRFGKALEKATKTQ